MPGESAARCQARAIDIDAGLSRADQLFMRSPLLRARASIFICISASADVTYPEAARPLTAANGEGIRAGNRLRSTTLRK
jgi:hypothetical protein